MHAPFWYMSWSVFCKWNDVTIESTGNAEKSQMEFEAIALSDLGGCSNRWGVGDSMVNNGVMWVFDSSCIAQLQIYTTTDSIACNCIVQSHSSTSKMRPTNHPNFGRLGGWLASSQICFNLTARLMQLWAMLLVVIWPCSCVTQLESKTHLTPLLTLETPVKNISVSLVARCVIIHELLIDKNNMAL